MTIETLITVGFIIGFILMIKGILSERQKYLAQRELLKSLNADKEFQELLKQAQKDLEDAKIRYHNSLRQFNNSNSEPDKQL